MKKLLLIAAAMMTVASGAWAYTIPTLNCYKSGYDEIYTITDFYGNMRIEQGSTGNMWTIPKSKWKTTTTHITGEYEYKSSSDDKFKLQVTINRVTGKARFKWRQDPNLSLIHI